MTQPTILRRITLPSDYPYAVNPFQDITDTLPKNAKGSWLTMPTRRKDGSVRTGPRAFGDIKRISVHHTGVEGGTAAGHARHHINKKTKSTPDGYGGIAYHIYIKGNQIYQVNDLLALTWHTGNNNYDTIGIVVEGNFAQRQLTADERTNLYAAIVTVMEMFQIPVDQVRGHREITNDTACPGFDMNTVRRDLRNIVLEMEYRRTEAYRAASIVDLYARVHSLYEIYQQKGQYWEDAERKLFTLHHLAQEYELMLPTQRGRTIA